MKVVAEAIEKAGTFDTDKVLKVMETTQFNTAWGPLKIGGMKTYGINRQFIWPIVITQVQDGKAVDIASFTTVE